jgi:Protein of unknown function (DUF2786)
VSDVILDKVRKLLAKAEDQACTPAEADAFNAKAAELIAKYGVDRALLAESDPGSDVVGDRVIDLPAPYALDKCSLLAGIATQLRCRAVQRRDRNGFAIHLFGFGSDLDRVELLFTSLLVQASQSLAVQRAPRAESLAAYRRSWLAGFTYAVVMRLRSAETRAAAEAEPGGAGRSVALVLADRSVHVTHRVTEAYPHLNKLGPRRLAGSGRGHGYAAGQRADLGGTKITGGARRAL